MSTVPRLETPRLILRSHRESDHEPATAIWTQEAVYRHITGSPVSAHDVWLRLLRYAGLWDYLGYGYWAVEERESGRYIGQMGFADFKRGLADLDEKLPEAGWLIDSDFAGRGLATEGMEEALRWLATQSNHRRCYCLISDQNLASIRVATKLGFALRSRIHMNEEETGVYFRDVVVAK